MNQKTILSDSLLFSSFDTGASFSTPTFAPVLKKIKNIYFLKNSSLLAGGESRMYIVAPLDRFFDGLCVRTKLFSTTVV